LAPIDYNDVINTFNSLQQDIALSAVLGVDGQFQRFRIIRLKDEDTEIRATGNLRNILGLFDEITLDDNEYIMLSEENAMRI
jgi:hypothetical protein